MVDRFIWGSVARISPEYRQAFIVANQVELQGEFEGSGILTDAPTVQQASLNPEDFIALLEMAHRSETLWKVFDPDPQGRNQFRVLTPKGLNLLVQIINRLVQTEAVKQAAAQSA